jgi:hypothetical protein
VGKLEANAAEAKFKARRACGLSAARPHNRAA